MCVRLADGTSEQVLGMLREGVADVALAEEVRLTWADLAGEFFVALGPGSSIRRLADLGFAQAGVEPRRRVETSTAMTAGGLIRTGLGVSAMPKLALALMPTTYVVTRPLGEPSITRKIALHRRPNERTPATVQHLIDRISAHAVEATEAVEAVEEVDVDSWQVAGVDV